MENSLSRVEGSRHPLAALHTHVAVGKAEKMLAPVLALLNDIAKPFTPFSHLPSSGLMWNDGGWHASS